MGAALIVLGIAIISLGSYALWLERFGATKGNLSTTESPRAEVPIPELSSLFVSDFPEYMSVTSGSTVTMIRNSDNKKFQTVVGLAQHFDMQAKLKFYSMYVPTSETTYEICELLAKTFPGFLGDSLNRIHQTTHIVGDSMPTTSDDLVFTGRLYIYHKSDLTDAQRGMLSGLFKAKGVDVRFRGPDYANTMWMKLRAEQK